jgi:hypothetical protein
VTSTAQSTSVAEFNFTGSAAVAVLVGGALAALTRSGAVALLVGIAAAQALLAFAWLLVLRVPGWRGGLAVGALAGAAADVATSVWPHSRLAAMLAVIALAVPVMFVHQLLRGAARVRVIESLGAIGVLVVAEASLPALLQLRHEFPAGPIGQDPTFAVVVVVAGALAAGYFADMVIAAPRFDAQVPRGLTAVVVSTAVGAGLGQVTLRDGTAFAGGRAVFVGAAVGVLVALLAVAVAFIESGTPLGERGFARRSRPVLSVLVPYAVVAPAAFLLCLAIRA